MNNEKHRMSISMEEQKYEALLELRCRPEYRSKSIAELIRVLIDKGLEEVEKDK